MEAHEKKTNMIELISPASGKSLNRPIPLTPIDQLPEIVSRSRKAQEKWANLDFNSRTTHLLELAKLIKDRSDYLAEKIHEHNGKLKEEALIAEIYPTLSNIHYFAKIAKRHLSPEKVFLAAVPFAKSNIVYEPLGVIGMIAPWNYPFFLALANLPAALMAGNSFILKPSEFSVGISLIIQELFESWDLPEELKDIVQVIYGYGDLGAALIESGIDKICFTGSTPTGKKVYQAAAAQMIPVTLEMGGKDSAIILEDADLDSTVKGVVWGGFVNCGQTCASVERVYIPQSRKDEFLTALKDYFDSLDPKNFGSMNTLPQKKIVEEHLKDAVSRGAEILCEKKLGHTDNPFIFNPAILVNVSKDSKLFNEETFGPLLPIFFYEDLDKVIKEVNQGSYGLTASVWTSNYERGELLAHQIRAGVITINDHMITPGFPEAPWIGHKESGLGFSLSHAALKSFSRKKYVYHDRGKLKFKFWQYPFQPQKISWLKSLMESQFSDHPAKKAFHTAMILPRLLFNKDEHDKKN